MEKKAILLLMIVAICSSFIDIQEEIVFWSGNSKLTYDDFKGQPDTKSKKPAESKFMVDILGSHLQNNIPKYNVRAFLKSKESWIVLCDEKTLNHEQLVFDIHEISARKIRKAFDSLNDIRVMEGETYQIVFDANMEKAEKQIQAFNHESASNPKKEKLWIDKIALELAQLQAYDIQSK